MAPSFSDFSSSPCSVNVRELQDLELETFLSVLTPLISLSYGFKYHLYAPKFVSSARISPLKSTLILSTTRLTSPFVCPKCSFILKSQNKAPPLSTNPLFHSHLYLGKYNSIHSIAQAKNTVVFLRLLSVTYYTEPSSKARWLYLQNISGI